MKSAYALVVLCSGFFALLALSACDDVGNADQAIAVAERACADAIKLGYHPGFLAFPEKSEGGSLKGWRVEGSYDASGNGVLSLVQMRMFVPRNGKPSECVSTTN